MTGHKTTAKSKDTPKKQRWVYPVCPICLKPFPYNAARYAYLVRVGRAQNCCSPKYGMQYRRMKKAAQEVPA